VSVPLQHDQTEIAMSTVYTAQCVKCGKLIHRKARIADGEAFQHDAFRSNERGQVSTGRCDGLLVSLMGRTADEAYLAAEAIRQSVIPAE